MATSDQIKSLISSHFLDESERFNAVALQIAAHEAQKGHNALASEIKSIVDKNRNKQESLFVSVSPELLGLILVQYSKIPKSSMVISTELSNRLKRIIHEFKQREKLKAYGLSHRRKILLEGPPGTGKTMTANVLATELNLPLFTIQVDQLVTKFMGETSAKLRLIFEFIRQENGVFLFDEFDAIGGKRSVENDVGEMRRVLNAFLQFIEQDSSDSLIIAATNNPNLLDNALFRRFDDILEFSLPTQKERETLIKNKLGPFINSDINWEKIVSMSEGFSHAELDFACKDAIKDAILSDQVKLKHDGLEKFIMERKRKIS